MSTRPSSPPAVSTELLQALLGPASPHPSPPTTITIHVQSGGCLTLVLAPHGLAAPSE